MKGTLLILAAGAALLLSMFYVNRDRVVAPPAPPALEDSARFADLTASARVERNLLSPTESVKASALGLLPANARSLLKIDRTLKHGEFVWNDDGVPVGPVSVWVDLRRQMVSVFRGGHEIGTAVVVYGATEMESPQGRFPILSKVEDYHSRTYDAPMPYSMFINNEGVALHGSPMSARRATHGCIGLPVEFARHLFEVARKGDVITIRRSDAKVEQAIKVSNPV